MSRFLTHLKDTTEYFNDLTDALGESDLPQAVMDSLPCKELSEAVWTSAAESAGLIKFFAKLGKELSKEKDIEKLGYAACTLAFQRTAAQAIRAIGQPEKLNRKPPRLKDTQQLEPSHEIVFSSIYLDAPAKHPFLESSLQILDRWAESTGHEAKDRRLLQSYVSRRFAANLKNILSHERTGETFRAFAERLRWDSEELRAQDALKRHLDYQHRLFEEEPVFNIEPFALKHVYVDMDCGKLTCGKIFRSPINMAMEESGKEPVDPHQENNGGRHSLLNTVISLMQNPRLKNPIFIQGSTGSGKTTSMLRLCQELRNEGLIPIYIRMRDIHFDDINDKPISLYIRLEADELVADDRLFDKSTFDVAIRFDKAEISDYVLIMDGWDELHTSSTEVILKRLERVLIYLRDKYQQKRKPTIRMILTGESLPGNMESFAHSILQKSPILTIRPLHPKTFNNLVKKTAAAKLEHSNTPNSFCLDLINKIQKCQEESVAAYSSQFNAYIGNELIEAAEFETMSLPLYACWALKHLSINSNQSMQDDRPSIRTEYFRRLVDMKLSETCQQDCHQKTPIQSEQLRRLLWKMAEAITICGGETIDSKELELRLEGKIKDVWSSVKQQTGKNTLISISRLLCIEDSNHKLSIEFVHKALREYLLAEGIIEALKDYARNHNKAPEDRLQEENWRDFENNDVRYALSRRLGKMFALKKISTDTAYHLKELLKWETSRNRMEDDKTENIHATTSTSPISLSHWEIVRDTMTGLWRWWIEEGNNRIQPADNANGGVEYNDSFTGELAKWACPQNGAHMTPPPSYSLIDAQLGDILGCLTSAIHASVSIERGFPNPWDCNQTGKSLFEFCRTSRYNYETVRCFQTEVANGDNKWLLFSPHNNGRMQDFRLLLHRITGGMDRLHCHITDFMAMLNLSGICLDGMNLRGAKLAGTYLIGASLKACGLQDVDLQRAILRFANLRMACLSDACMKGAILEKADLEEADLRRANLQDANLREANFVHANLQNANLQKADFLRAKLWFANLREADLRWTRHHEAHFFNADLRNANLQEANLSVARLANADLSNASLKNADIRWANLQRASLKWVDLQNANLRRSNLEEASLIASNLAGANFQKALLRWADLSCANMEGADFQDAVLSRAYLLGTDLRTANLEGASFNEAIIDKRTKFPHGFDMSRLNPE